MPSSGGLNNPFVSGGGGSFAGGGASGWWEKPEELARGNAGSSGKGTPANQDTKTGNEIEGSKMCPVHGSSTVPLANKNPSQINSHSFQTQLDQTIQIQF